VFSALDVPVAVNPVDAWSLARLSPRARVVRLTSLSDASPPFVLMAWIMRFPRIWW
jgi:hypothetical protein